MAVCTIEIPSRVADDLLADERAIRSPATRSGAEVAGAALTVFGATANTVTLIAGREAFLDLSRRVLRWCRHNADPGTHLHLRIGDSLNLDYRLPTSATQDEQLVAEIAAELLRGLAGLG